jgi:archaellum component FlaC
MSQVLEKKIDTLTQAVVSGFNHMEERFNNMEERFNDVEKRLSKLEQRMESVENHLDRIVDDVRVLKTSVEKIEKQILEDHAHRLQRLESQLAR